MNSATTTKFLECNIYKPPILQLTTWPTYLYFNNFSRWTWVSEFPPLFSSTCFRGETLRLSGTGIFAGRVSFLTSNEQCQSTERNNSCQKLWPKIEEKNHHQLTIKW